MCRIFILSALMACAAAAPGYLVAHHEPVVHAVHAVPSKLTITSSGHSVNHGGHAILHAPVVHSAPLVHTVHTKSTITKSSHAVNHGGHTLLHAPVVPVVHTEAHLVHSTPVKSTITRSSQVVNHGGHALVHAPVVHTHVPVHAHHAPVLSVKTGDSAVSHSSQSVHETVPLVAVHSHH